MLYKKTGKKLTYEQLLQFVKANCIDLNEKGKDDSTGYGLFILPKLEEKMFKDYKEWEQAIDLLSDKKRINSPSLWKKRIIENNDADLMWFCVKWANDVKKLEK